MGRLSDFNPDSVEDRKYSLVPEGEHLVIITESDERESKTTPGNFYQNMKLQIVKGDSEGRMLTLRLNLWNSNPTAKTIAEQQLKDIYRALNIERVDEFEELNDRPFWIKVKIKNDQNEVAAILWKKTNDQARATAKSSQGTPSKAAIAAKKADFVDDDIPF
jgi:hypothetical protein